MANYSRKVIAGSIGYSTVIDPKFKSSKIKVMFLTGLDEHSAAANAMAVGIMGSSNSKYKNISEITAKLNSLYGASINVDIVKQGDIQRLCIGVTSINNRFALENEDISSEVLSILLDCIFSPNAQNGEFAKEPFDFRKKDLLDTIEAEINNKRGYTMLQTQRKAFEGEPAQNSPYGTKEAAKAVTAKDAYEAYKKLLSDSQIEVYFVGSEEDTKAEQMIAEKFSAVKRAPQNVSFISPSSAKNEILRFEEKLDVIQCKMALAFKTDSRDYDALRLFSTIFGATPFSKLFMNVREKLSLCYYCASSFSILKGTLFVDCGVEAENIEKAEREILRQLDDMKNGSFTDEEMNNSLLSLENSLKSTGDTTGSYIGWYFGRFMRGDSLTPQEAAQRYRAVTRERVIEAAKSLKLDTVYVMKGEG